MPNLRQSERYNKILSHKRKNIKINSTNITVGSKVRLMISINTLVPGINSPTSKVHLASVTCQHDCHYPQSNCQSTECQPWKQPGRLSVPSLMLATTGPNLPSGVFVDSPGHSVQTHIPRANSTVQTVQP